ncbi:lysophospholipase catalytic domain-containing protein [Stachybotrys elegans]|uniref:Lysophospholipase n=1 Tax=Stachybotrys elegans TaxID=80388 RepID=A0A8K0SFZ5_9HYPO|nr:lysophospholipase catalytic domain-containing protein [Stachybotrys elegans]
MGIFRQLTVLLVGTTALHGAMATHHTYQVSGAISANINAYPRSGAGVPNDYTPISVSCPDRRPAIRNASHVSALSSQEREWIQQRRNETVPHIRRLLSRLSIPGFDSDDYLRGVEDDSEALPTIGLAVSGGGYRAMLSGAGALAAWDSRSDGSETNSNLGGVLQSATFLSGLSGGAWLVGSLYVNGWSSVHDLRRSGSLWQTQSTLLEGPEHVSLLSYYSEISGSVGDKGGAGYERSITDYWGRMLSRQLVDASDGGPGITFSAIANLAQFRNAETPLPIITAVGRDPGETVISTNSTVFEFSPWELGSQDPTLRAYAPLRYVGSAFDGGELPNREECITGFDNAGFVMGTSSSLFNAIVLELRNPDSQHTPDGIPSFLISGVTDVLSKFGETNNDIADWSPNPFRNYNNRHPISSDSERLTLVDGGEDGQNIPYHPHLITERQVDVVFSIDSSADTELGWPNGASIIATYERSLANISEGTGFPVVPGSHTFINLGLNTRPVFFGCDTSNITERAPLIIYLPNFPYIYQSNISTFSMSISEGERDAMIQNGWAVATMHNATRDESWPICVGCAILHHSFERTNTTVPEACRSCFNQYCWNGTIDESEPAPYEPTPFGTLIEVEGAASVMAGNAAVAMLIFAVASTSLML